MSARITEAMVREAQWAYEREITQAVEAGLSAEGISEARTGAIRAALAAALSTEPGEAARPEAEWHEDYGDAVWWTWRDGQWLGEAAFIGSPLGSDWPGYHTHWTPHPAFPAAPLPEDTHHGT